jgi:RNA recognition motif-containing protein
MVENPENCLRYFAFPPGTSMEDVLRVFKDFKLKQSTLGSPIAFSPSKRCALVEFESKDEAHRAFRKLVGKEIVSSMGNWTLCLELML